MTTWEWVAPALVACLVIGGVGLIVQQVFLRWNMAQELRQALITIAISVIIADQVIAHFPRHVPAGAVPKDGPSAGVAMFTALASLFSNKAVRSDVAMTGEITLRGMVLPIGGLKEKSLAAMRADISTVIIPKLNEKDLVDVPEEAKQKLRFIPVETVEEVLAHALDQPVQPVPADAKPDAL